MRSLVLRQCVILTYLDRQGRSRAWQGMFVDFSHLPQVPFYGNSLRVRFMTHRLTNRIRQLDISTYHVNLVEWRWTTRRL